jgi:hypothetical protein
MKSNFTTPLYRREIYSLDDGKSPSPPRENPLRYTPEDDGKA